MIKENKGIKVSTQKLSVTGLMAALVFASTFFSIQIPISGLNVMIHLGNVFCILSALLLGPWFGGAAAGIGSFIYDLTSPIYITSAPFTLVFKFIMGFVCGKISHYDYKNKSKSKNYLKKDIIGSIFGLAIYILLHLTKAFIKNLLLGVDLKLNFILISQSSIVSAVNAVLAILIAVPLSRTLKKALQRSNLF